MKRATAAVQARKRNEESDTTEDRHATRRFVIEYPYGFHARPAALFAKTALQYDSDVQVGKNGQITANGKSIMGLLTLEIQRGEVLTVTAQGPDAEEAMSAFENLFLSSQAPRELMPVPIPHLTASAARA